MKQIASLVAVAALAACSGPSDDGDDTDVPAPDYIAWGSSASTVTLAWRADLGASSYTIERGASPDTLAAIATVPAGKTSFLDTGLDPLTTYHYRLTVETAAGSDVLPSQDATTTADEILISPVPAAIGAPITEAVGAAGAAIEVAAAGVTVVVPPGAVPDGTMVTIQPVGSPVAEDPDAAGVTITSSETFAVPAELVFAYDEIDALEPDLVTIALHADDGSWIAQPRVLDRDAGTATLTLPVDARDPTATFAAPIRYHAAVRMRSTFIIPRRADVLVGGTVNLKPYGLFSDDPCDDPDSSVLCTVIVAAGLGTGLISAHDAFRPARRYVKPLANSKPGYERTWTVNLAIGGSNAVGRVVPSGAVGAIYTAPDMEPTENPVAVRFASVQLSPRRPVTPVPSYIKVTQKQYELRFRYDGESAIGSDLNADVTDEFTIVVAPKANGEVTLVEGPTNMASTVANPRPADPTTTAVQTSPFEFLTVTQVTLGGEPGLTAAISGTTQIAGTLVTFQGSNQPVPFPGGVQPITWGLVFDSVRFAEITTPRSFTDLLGRWHLDVTPR